MDAQNIYNRLKAADSKTYHLVLAGLFELVFDRKLASKEWGYFRKIINIYGPEAVYWAILNSAHISGDSPLPYIAKVCMNTLQESVASPGDDIDELISETRKRIIAITGGGDSVNTSAEHRRRESSDKKFAR